MMKVDIYVMQDLQVKEPKLASKCLRLAREEYDDLWEERSGMEFWGSGVGTGVLRNFKLGAGVLGDRDG